jgi:hypothetical protein
VPLPISVSRLLDLSGSTNASLRDFRRKLRTAMGEVADVERADGREFSWRLDANDLVHVARG